MRHRFQQRQPWALALVVTPLRIWVGCRSVPALGSEQRRQHAARQPRARLCWCSGCPAVRRLRRCHDPQGIGAAGTWRGGGRPRLGSVAGGGDWWRPEVRWSASSRPRCCVSWPSLRRTFPTAPVSSPSVTSPTSAGSPACRIRLLAAVGVGAGHPNLFNIESSTTGWPGHLADHLTEQLLPEAAADELARLGVTHVAVINDQAAQPFLASSRFATVWRSHHRPCSRSHLARASPHRDHPEHSGGRPGPACPGRAAASGHRGHYW